MNTEPLVSVLMPAYNTEKYIGEAIESILDQTYTNFEFIILDDCSTDNTWNIIQKYSKTDSRIRAYRNKKNLGRPVTKNKLLNKISKNSKYFTWIGSDDIFLKNCINTKVSFLEKNQDIDGVGSSIEYVNEKLNTISVRNYPKTFEEIKKTIYKYSPFSEGGIMLRKELSKTVYDQRFEVCQDYDLWFRLIKDGCILVNLNEVFYLYRQHSLQGKKKKTKLTILNTIKIKVKNSDINFFLPRNLIRFIGEIILLILPKQISLWLFLIDLKKNNK